MTHFSGPTSHSFISQRLRLHYVDWGNPDAPPLILQHGGRDHCRSWDWVAQELRHDWHVICPDLRGHGDSAWSPDGSYTMQGLVYDFAQLVETVLEPGHHTQVTVCAHSLGGMVATTFAGLYPEKIRKFANIEGLGLNPAHLTGRDAEPYLTRLREWIAKKHAASARLPHRYANMDAAFLRMKEENKHLSDEQARHLTLHAAARNEDGTWSWKFDNYLNVWPVEQVQPGVMEALWGAITCPMLLFYGTESFATNPEKDGRLAHLRDARVIEYENAGHWLHHDQFARFAADLKAFLG